MSAPAAPAPTLKIGVFDSGVGGLSVVREIHRALPAAATLYYADQAHLPYGERAAGEILYFVDAALRFLRAQGAALLVLACHAASAGALAPLRDRYPDFPIVGIEPAVKPAAAATRSGVIGVLTTRATAAGALYRSVVDRFARDVTVITQIAPELVALVERGAPDTPESRALVAAALAPMQAAGVDHVVLACTHFPFLAAQVAAVMGDTVRIVDPAPAVARQTARVAALAEPTSSSVPEHAWFTTGDPAAFALLLHHLIGIDAPVAHIIPLSSPAGS